MSIVTKPIHQYKGSNYQLVDDSISIEEPLEITLFYELDKKIVSQNVAITMRTPSQDKELAIGFLFTENIISDKDQIDKIETLEENKISVYLKHDADIQLDRLKRNFYTTSSCGVCGKASLDAIYLNLPKHDKPNDYKISKKYLLSYKDKIVQYQSDFSQTGGIHASIMFNQEGEILSLFEDVGRHNALDKLIGHHILLGNSSLEDYILVLSGRVSFELMQKAAMAQFRVVCALGAPSSLAIEMANRFDILLIGFLKSNSFNVYTNHIGNIIE